MGKLDETTNFIQLYAHHVGRSEVPIEFQEWACISLIAACVADRVWIEKFRGSRLAPNLYVFLVGPSGLGKGIAIDTAVNLVRDHRRVNVYQGKTTAQYLLDFLGRPMRTPDGRSIVANAKVFLITPELSMSVGDGGQAVQFIKHMTELYTGGDYDLREGTRTRGPVLIRNHCLNWLAGTTMDWLTETIPKSAVTGGFFGRTVAVNAKYDLGVRYRRPIYPTDYDEVVDFLQARILEFCHIEGSFAITQEAEDMEEAWYMKREAPADEALLASWKREHDLTLKLAMIHSLADSLDLTIDKAHMMRAQKTAAMVMKSLPGIVDAASATMETTGVQEVVELLKKYKKIHHSVLLQRVYRRGITADRLAQIINTLTQARQIVRHGGMGPSGGFVYEWLTKHRLNHNE